MKNIIASYTKKDKRNGVLVALVIIAFAIFPFFSETGSFFTYYLFTCFIYITLSQGWNLVAGYTGQISMGSHAFFALGGYTTAILWIHDVTKTWYYYDPLVMILSGVVPAIFAVLIGFPLLSRLRGDYFAFGTLAAAEVLKLLILRGGNFTHGAHGLRLPVPEGGFSGLDASYWTALLVAVLATAAVFFITRSKLGLALRGLREDEMAAASHGINILKYKIMIFAIGAFLMGVCGSLWGYYLTVVSPPAVLTLDWMFLPIFICVLGGNGTVLGPVIGALLVGLLFSYGDVYVGQLHPTISGVTIILVMKFLPTGLMGLKDRLFPRR